MYIVRTSLILWGFLLAYTGGTGIFMGARYRAVYPPSREPPRFKSTQYNRSQNIHLFWPHTPSHHIEFKSQTKILYFFDFWTHEVVHRSEGWKYIRWMVGLSLWQPIRSTRAILRSLERVYSVVPYSNGVNYFGKGNSVPQIASRNHFIEIWNMERNNICTYCLESMSECARDYLRPQWVEDEYKKYKQDMLCKDRKKRRKDKKNSVV